MEDAIREYRASGLIIALPFFLTRKAEALRSADRTSSALYEIKKAQAHVEKSEERWWSAELQRLQGTLLSVIGADEAEIEEAFSRAIAIAKKQGSLSLTQRAEASYAEYRSRKGGP